MILRHSCRLVRFSDLRYNAKPFVLYNFCMSLFRPFMFGLMILVVSFAAPAWARVVTDFSDDLPAAGYPDATITLRLVAIRELPDVKDHGDVFVVLRRAQGAFAQTGHTAAADYNQKSTNAVNIESLKLQENTLVGAITATIGPDAPRPGAKGFPTPSDVFSIDIDATIDTSTQIAYQPDANAFMPPWRRDEPRAGGQQIVGTFVARRGDITTRGQIIGAIQPDPTPTRIGTSGNMVIGPDPAGGIQLNARLSPHRVASDQAMMIKRLDDTFDATAFDAIRLTLVSDKRRTDAAVMLAINVAGQWRKITQAAFLIAKEQTVDVPLDDFGLFDASKLRAIGVGVDNPMGVGDVTFSIRKIELVSLGLQRHPSKTQITLSIDPDRVVSFNGQAEIPKGLFGFHDVGQNKPRAPKPGEPDAYAFLKQINPGYLRPLDHVGFNAKALSDEQIAERANQKHGNPESVFYRRVASANAVDHVVWTHTTDLWNRPPWMDAGIEKTADGVRAFYRELASRAWRPGDDANLLRRVEVWNEPFMWARHTNMGKLNPAGKKAWTDPTQFGYLPGKMLADAWATFFLAATEGAKSANPHLLLGGPSTSEFQGYGFATLDNYVGPILDRVHDKIDFLTEHHYGGDARSFAASYDVVKAWCDVRYDKRIPIYNTECNDLGASSAGKAAYNMLDILTCIRESRDISVGRAMHALWDGYLRDEGEKHCYQLLSSLRGAVLDADSDDEQVTVVASHPAQSQKAVIVAMNHGPANKRVTLPLPEGFAIDEVTVLLADAPDAELQLRDTEGQAIPKPADGKTSLVTLADKPVTVSLPRASAVRWTISKPGYAPTQRRDITQHFADGVLLGVSPDQPSRLSIKWRTDPAGAKRAFLRVVTNNVQRDQAQAVIGDQVITLARSSSNEGEIRIQSLEIDPSKLTRDSTITFRCVDPDASNGFKVWAASVCIEK